VPLKGMPPGTYTLRVAAGSRMGKKPPSAERALLVQVLPPAPSPPPAAAASPPVPSPAPSPGP